MQNQNRKTIASLLSVQIIITIIYAFALTEVLINSYVMGGLRGMEKSMISYLPYLVVFICSLGPQAALLFKHKLHSQDGEIMPPLFTMVALQASFIVVDAASAMGYIFIYPEALLIIQRFSLLGTAALFLLSALRYHGFSSSNIAAYTFLFLGISFLLSALVPFSSYHGEMSTLNPGYEMYIQLAVIAVYITAIVTFIIAAVKDKTSLNVKRSIAFILFALSVYLAYYNSLYTAIASAVFAISATIILIMNAGDSL